MTSRSRLFRFPTALKHDPAVDAWLVAKNGELGRIARHWFAVMRACGNDVRELLHDGHPTACVEDTAFAYVNVFKGHVNVGFFRGTEIADPAQLLEGSGKLMRHVKLLPHGVLDDVALAALVALIQTAYLDMQARVRND